METLLKSIGDETNTQKHHQSQSSLKKQQPQYQQVQETHKPQKSKKQPIEPNTTLTSMHARKKVVRYHGSSSGYYLMGNILSNQEEEEEEQEPQQPTIEEDPKVFTINSGPNTYRLRRVNQNDDDLMVVRDLTADEDACQSAIGLLFISCFVPSKYLNHAAFFSFFFSSLLFLIRQSGKH
jgi:hypothetical protein